MYNFVIFKTSQHDIIKQYINKTHFAGYCTRSNRRGVCHSTSINPMNKFITRSNVLGKFLWLNMEEDTNITSAYSYLISSFLQPNFKDNHISRCFSFWFMILVNITNNKDTKKLR